MPSSVHRFVGSIRHAIRGAVFLVRREENIRRELVIAGAVIACGLFLSLERMEWMLLVGAMTAVLVTEAINTSLERSLDLLRPRLEAQVRVIKDSMAAAVLCTAIGACVIGFGVFIPALMRLIAV